MTTDLDLPHSFATAVRRAHGPEGARWLEELPELVAGCREKWQLTIGSNYPLATHYVAPGRTADGTPVVLKLGISADETIGRQGRVLERLRGEGAVMLLDRDWDRRALLLERAVPGLSLASRCAEDDGEATVEATLVLQRLWRPASAALRLPAVAALGAAFHRYRAAHGSDGPLPAGLVDRAERVFDELVASSKERTLLHGDLHHGNILSASRSRWLAIDPHGLTGDRAFDCASLLYNPHRHLRSVRDLEARLLQRITTISERLGLDRERVLAWGFAKAVLSELWSVEDEGVVNGLPQRVAETLTPHLP